MSGCLGADLNLACDVKRGSMFALTTLKALKSVTCPQIDTCKRDPCIYSHEPPKPRAGSSNDASASDTVHQTTTSQGNTASVKRPLPPLDDFSRLNKCKVQKPNPSPSSSSISSAKATSSSDPLKSLKLEQFSVMTSHTNEEARSGVDIPQQPYPTLPGALKLDTG